MRRLFALLILSVPPVVAPPAVAVAEDRPRAGLMWNRSGLPATFPLVVKTPAGDDYVLFVADPQDGRAVMAGYIRGGEFFRLLLPPGEWRLRFAHGRDWQGEDDLFGAGTAWIEPPQPLDFRLLGLDRRRAYVVTLGEGDDGTTVADARADAECQLVLWDSRNRDWPEDGPEDRPGTSPGDLDLLDRGRSDDPGRPRLRYLDREFGIHTRLCG